MNLIVLVDNQWGIGYQGEQMIYLSQDLKRFKELTQDTTVVLGRKTLCTFPNEKPLPNRRNLILSHNASTVVEGGEVFSSVEDLKSAISEKETVFVIGGSTVYNAFLSSCKKAYITKVRGSFPVDCYFPNLDEMFGWELVEESGVYIEKEVEFTYCTYENKLLQEV